MNKPYIICHMMASVDGRIDCGMTAQLSGVESYYATLNQLDTPTTLSGRVTAQTEMALPGIFEAENPIAVNQDGYYKAMDANGYDVVVDTKGTLLWEDQKNNDKPILVITSQKASQQYLDYLKDQHVSYIVSGKDSIDLTNACAVLHDQFHVNRMAVVGGPLINGAFLKLGLLDEVSVLIGPGIDGRKGYPGVFDRFDEDAMVTPLKFKSVQPFTDGSVSLCYHTVHG